MAMVAGADIGWSAVWRPVEIMAWWRMPSYTLVGLIDGEARGNEDLGRWSWFVRSAVLVRLDWRKRESKAS
jgi:hypothetical protein